MQEPISETLGPASVRKLPARYLGIVMPLVLTFFMTCVVSLISTLCSLGLADHLLRTWLSAWALSWAVAFPTMTVILPHVRRLVGRFVELA